VREETRAASSGLWRIRMDCDGLSPRGHWIAALRGAGARGVLNLPSPAYVRQVEARLSRWENENGRRAVADRGFSKSQIAGARQGFFLRHFASAARAKVARKIDRHSGTARQIRRIGLWKEQGHERPQRRRERVSIGDGAGISCAINWPGVRPRPAAGLAIASGCVAAASEVPVDGHA
jgi:hypothetical protein